jgi:hypothetical protein
MLTRFFQGTYPDSHWASKTLSFSDDHLIAFAHYKQHQYAIYLNPGDCRGYRSVVRLHGPNVYNRPYTDEEYAGLFNVTSAVYLAYNKLVPITQMAIAGNNAQTVDNDIVVFGSENEPNMLHSHIWARGVLNTEYITGCPLSGPKVGELFNMREGKVSWTSGMKTVSAVIRSWLKDTTDITFEKPRNYVGWKWS